MKAFCTASWVVARRLAPCLAPQRDFPFRTILQSWLVGVCGLYLSLTLASVDNEAVITKKCRLIRGLGLHRVIHNRTHQKLCKSFNSLGGGGQKRTAGNGQGPTLHSVQDQCVIRGARFQGRTYRVWPVSCSWQAVCNPRSLTFAGAGQGRQPPTAATNTQSQLRRA